MSNFVEGKLWRWINSFPTTCTTAYSSCAMDCDPILFSIHSFAVSSTEVDSDDALFPLWIDWEYCEGSQSLIANRDLLHRQVLSLADQSFIKSQALYSELLASTHLTSLVHLSSYWCILRDLFDPISSVTSPQRSDQAMQAASELAEYATTTTTSKRFAIALGLCSSIEKTIFQLLGQHSETSNALLRQALEDPSLVIDIDSAERSSVGIAFLKHLLLPKGINLRNLLWHGFIAPSHLDIRYICLLFLLYLTLSRQLGLKTIKSNNNHNNHWKRRKISSEDNDPIYQTSLFYKSTDYRRDFMTYSNPIVRWIRSVDWSNFEAECKRSYLMGTNQLDRIDLIKSAYHQIKQIRVLYVNHKSDCHSNSNNNHNNCNSCDSFDSYEGSSCRSLIWTSLLQLIPILEQILREVFCIVNSSDTLRSVSQSTNLNMQSIMSQHLCAQEGAYYTTLDGFGQRSKHQLLLEPLLCHLPKESYSPSSLCYTHQTELKLPNEEQEQEQEQGQWLDQDKDQEDRTIEWQNLLPQMIGCDMYSLLIDLFLASAGANVRSLLAHCDAIARLYSSNSNEVATEAEGAELVLLQIAELILAVIYRLCVRFQMAAAVAVDRSDDNPISNDTIQQQLAIGFDNMCRKCDMVDYQSQSVSNDRIIDRVIIANMDDCWRQYRSCYHPMAMLYYSLNKALASYSELLLLVDNRQMLICTQHSEERSQAEDASLTISIGTAINNYTSNLDCLFAGYDHSFSVVRSRVSGSISIASESSSDQSAVRSSVDDSNRVELTVVDKLSVLSAYLPCSVMCSSNEAAIGRYAGDRPCSEGIAATAPSAPSALAQSIAKHCVASLQVFIDNINSDQQLASEQSMLKSIFLQLQQVCSFGSSSTHSQQRSRQISELFQPIAIICESRLNLLSTQAISSFSSWMKVLEWCAEAPLELSAYLLNCESQIQTGVAKSSTRRKYFSYLIDGIAVMSSICSLSLACLISTLVTSLPIVADAVGTIDTSTSAVGNGIQVTSESKDVKKQQSDRRTNDSHQNLFSTKLLNLLISFGCCIPRLVHNSNYNSCSDSNSPNSFVADKGLLICMQQVMKTIETKQWKRQLQDFAAILCICDS